MSSGDMATSTNEKNSSRLARIRENQRRSRARKQEYTQELEQKLSDHEAVSNRKDIQHRISIQRLELENVKLRQLLYEMGVQSGTVDAYLQENGDPLATSKVAIPRQMELERPQMPYTNDCSSKSPEGQLKPSDDDLQLVTQSTSPARNEQGTTSCCPQASDNNITEQNDHSEESGAQHPANTTTTAEPPAASDRPTCGAVEREESTLALPTPEGGSVCECTDEQADSWPANESRFGTTLCAIAGELIRQYNTLGVDPTDIQKRLKAGFRKEMAKGEGCRVSNQLLFEVLDQISGNLS